MLLLAPAPQAVAEAKDAVTLDPRAAKGWVRLADAMAAVGGKELQVGGDGCRYVLMRAYAGAGGGSGVGWGGWGGNQGCGD